ncbi:MAG: sigma-54-dependent Fis family transcriptional regulator, partial [Rhizobacter sp.]|nr:sigma-54-dependent Fis family transcriptional regulator [Rhizobacter sp.]
GTGLDLLRWLEESGRREKTIVITAYGSAENAVEALKAGAYDYLTKPVDLKQFRAVVGSALGRGGAVGGPTVDPARLPSENAASVTLAPGVPAALPAAALLGSAAVPTASLPTSLAGLALARMAGDSAAMQQVRALVEKVARSMAPVLVQGESGTGKELVARAIHEVSARSNMPFIAVNCSAIPEQLLEAEFFGYRKGAFTGAAEDREGFFQAANGGTLFLDEIGDLPLAMQSKLLRAIQERSVRPVGAINELPVNVRILSATHKDLSAEVQSGQFRQDLYYRLNVIQIRVPPLRERIEDLPVIVDRVLQRIAADAEVSPAPSLTREALVHLSRYAFPGNVRELENLLHRAVALSGEEEIGVADVSLPDSVMNDGDLFEAEESSSLPVLPSAATASTEPAAQQAPAVVPLPDNLERYLDGVEREILIRALERYRFNRTAAGASMGLSLRQMRYRMARLGVSVGEQTGLGDGDRSDRN